MSASHTFHPDSHTHGLADDCPRCEEHAQNPLVSLDADNLSSLMQRVVNREGYRSDNEREAMLNLRRALDQACLLAQGNPLMFAKFAKEQYGLNLVAVL